MTLTHAFRAAQPWWPAPIALVILLSMALSLQLQGTPALMGAVLILGALAVSRRWPLAALGTALLGAVIVAPSEPTHSWFLLSLGFATAALAAWGVEPLQHRLLSGLAVALAAGVATGWHAEVATPWGFGSGTAAMVFVAWLLAMLAWGVAVGGRALRDALRAEAVTQQAVARTTVVESELRDERLRADLTHDFHDVMAHSLAVLAAQAEGLRLTHRAHPERIDPVLTTISDTARLALVEVRQLLERVDDDARRPQPTSTDIPGLVTQLRSAGPRVALHETGTHGRLSRLADIAAYRIVQESLTNALRHGGTDIDIVVTLAWTGPGLTLGVTSPIRDGSVLGSDGRGIAGMRERARLAGGALEVDATGDSFAVSAYLPYEPVGEPPVAPLVEDAPAPLTAQAPVQAPSEAVDARLVEARAPGSAP